jgi:hypothetical protein
LIIKVRVGKENLLLSGIDLLSDLENRREDEQLRYGLKKYMVCNLFDSDFELVVKDILVKYN